MAVNGAWRSLVAHLLWEQGVGGSNPSAPTNLLVRYGKVRRGLGPGPLAIDLDETHDHSVVAGVSGRGA